MMLFPPSLFAATLTQNTVPYVCQGGANPQLCNSNLTTDSNGNVGIGTSAPDTSSFTPGTTYQATAGAVFVQCYSNYGGGAELAIQEGPTSALENGNVAYAQSAAVGGQTVYDTLTALIPKNYYWRTASAGASPCGGGPGGKLTVTRIGL